MGNREPTREALLAEVSRLRQRVQALEKANGDQAGAPSTDATATDATATDAHAADATAGQGAPESAALGRTYSQEQLITILESMPSAVVIINAADGRFVYVNRRAHELYGTDYVGFDLNEHIPLVQAMKPDGRLYSTDELPAARSIREGITVYNEQIMIRQAGGQELTVLVSSAPLRDSDGRIIAAVASFRDITERNQVEKDLKSALDIAEARTRELETVFSSVPDGLILYNRTRQPVFINDEARRLLDLFHVSIKPQTGNEFTYVYYPDGRRVPEEDAPLYRILNHGDTIRSRIYMTAPDRDPISYIALSGAPVSERDGTVIGAVILARDITENRKSMRTIAFQAHLLDCVQDAIIATDESFHNTYLNKAAEALFGWSAAEALGRTTFELMDPIVQEPSMDEAIEKLWKNDAYVGEVIYHHKDGTPIIVENHARLIRDEQGNVRETVTSARDIRERKKTEIALRESERRYRELVRHAPTGIYEIDISRHRFLSVNDCMTFMTGYTQEQLLAMDPMDLLDDASYQIYLGRLRQWESGKTPDPNVDYTWIVKDGRMIHVALNTTFEFDSEGKPKVMTVIAHNVTERKQLEMTLKRQAEELLIANRNKNQFLNMLSHELRNPLAAIIASLDLLTHVKPDEDRAERALRVLRRQAGHLSHLVDDLLDVTRITTNKIRLEKEPIDIGGLIQRMTADLLPQFEAKGVALHVNLISGQDLVVMADPTRIIQAIGNLLHNALKFTQGGGTVTVSISREDWSPDDAVNATGAARAAGTIGAAGATPKNRQAVRITIEDNGAGIAPDILPSIFEPFSQAEQPLARTQGGLGLGLAIVKGMIELHGGRVEAASDGVGRGAQFAILLPMESDT